MPLCFWATQTVVAASVLFVGPRSKFTPYLPPYSAASPIQLAYQSYVRRVSLHNNLTVPMLFTRITFRVLRSQHPFDCSVKSAYRQYICLTKINTMQTIFELDWMPFTGYATKDTLIWMWNRNCFAAQWMF